MSVADRSAGAPEVETRASTSDAATISEVERFVRTLDGLAQPTDRGLRIVLRHGGLGPIDTSQAFVWTDADDPAVLVKIARGQRGRDNLRSEHARLVRYTEALAGERPGTVPRPLGLTTTGGLTLLGESHLSGRRLKDAALSSEELDEVLEETVSWLIAFQRAVGVQRVDIDSDQAAPWLIQPIGDYTREFETSDAETSLLDNLRQELPACLTDGLPLVQAHGDFSDANVLLDRSRVAVVDWGEPVDRTLPGVDLFHFLLSITATGHGLGERDAFERAFDECFFTRGRTSERNRRLTHRYLDALEISFEAARPLFAMAWVWCALHKLRYLRLGAGPDTECATFFAQPQTESPLTFFADGGCLNVRLTAERQQEIAL